MSSPLSRRNLVLSLLAMSASGALLAACGEQQATQPASDGTAAQPAAAAQVPPSQGQVDIDRLMASGALPDMSLGEEDAPVTIVEYASLTCSHCANFHERTLPTIKERFIDTGKARLILREFPIDPRAEAGFMLARCSGDNYFAMTDTLFRQQRNWAPVENARDALLQLARMAGFSQESFEACLTDQQLLDDVRSVRAYATSELRVEATPTFFINGHKYAGALSVDEMSAIIESML